MKQNQVQQKEIRLGTHGEHYGSWMSNPVFYVIGALLALSVVLAVLSFAVFHITALGVVFVIAAVILLALLLWCAWIRRQYAFVGGGMMDRIHLTVLSHLDFDGKGQLLDVGCGSGPLSIRAALTWPNHLPLENENAPYPFVLVGSVQTLPVVTKNAVQGQKIGRAHV